MPGNWSTMNTYIKRNSVLHTHPVVQQQPQRGQPLTFHQEHPATYKTRANYYQTVDYNFPQYSTMDQSHSATSGTDTESSEEVRIIAILVYWTLA